MIYIGLDPGNNGAIAEIREVSEGQQIVTYSLKKYTLEELADYFGESSLEITVLVETQHAFPGYKKEKKTLPSGESYDQVSPARGITATWTFAQHYGEIRGILAAMHIKRDFIAPKDWQKAIGITPKEKTESHPAWKRRLAEKARELFPGVKVTLVNADALLLAEVCRRIYNKPKVSFDDI